MDILAVAIFGDLQDWAKLRQTAERPFAWFPNTLRRPALSARPSRGWCSAPRVVPAP